MRNALLGIVFVSMGCAGMTNGKSTVAMSSAGDKGEWKVDVADAEWANKDTPATRGADVEQDSAAVVPALGPQPAASPSHKTHRVAAKPAPKASDEYTFDEAPVASEPTKRVHRKRHLVRVADKPKRKKKRAHARPKRIARKAPPKRAPKRVVRKAPPKRVAASKRPAQWKRIEPAKKNRVKTRRVAASKPIKARPAKAKPAKKRAPQRMVARSSSKSSSKKYKAKHQRKLAEVDGKPYHAPVYDDRGQAIDDEVPPGL